MLGAGSIPAWAGKPRDRAGDRPGRRVYPRVGGETVIFQGAGTYEQGLSPRGRGNRWAAATQGWSAGSIPAWAGKPERSPRSHATSTVYPRVGGETPHFIGDQASLAGLSPRGRGNPGDSSIPGYFCGSIPAWAGKPSTWRMTRPRCRVYPRVGGETKAASSMMTRPCGLSPRGRGNPDGVEATGDVEGSIPAWAGKPASSTPHRRAGWVYPRVGGETRATDGST